MENSFVEQAEQFYEDVFAPERNAVTKDLKRLKDEIQKEDCVQKKGSIAYSGVGIMGGALIIGGLLAAPVTGGASLAVTSGGFAAEMVSGAAEYLHDKFKTKRVNRTITCAKESLQKHEKTCLAMHKYLQPLELEIESLKEKVDKLEQSQSNSKENLQDVLSFLKQLLNEIQEYKMKTLDLEHFLSSIGFDFAKAKFLMSLRVLKEGVTSPPAVLGTLAGVAMVGDVYSLTMNINDLADERRLCKEARLLNDIIEQIEGECEQLGQRFVAYRNIQKTMISLKFGEWD